MLNQIILALSILILITIGIKYFFFKNSIIETKIITKIDKNTEEITSMDLNDSLLSLKDMLDSIKDKNLSNLDIVKNMGSDSLYNSLKELEIKEFEESLEIYEDIDIEELEREMPTKKLVKPVLGITIKEKSIAKLNIGDTIKLPEINSFQYEAKITEKITHKNGSVSVTGNLLPKENKQYSIIFTEGKKNTYASISTPEGAFDIETINGKGYVYSVKEMDKKYIDKSKEDFILVP